MRRLALLLAALPTALFADDIPLATDVTGVTLYPEGATVIRQVPFSAPAGEHRLILADLPRSTPLSSVRVAVDGATMGSVSLRDDYVPPRPDDTDAAIAAARARVEELESALRAAEAEVAEIRLEAQAAHARVAFLEALGKGDGVAELDVGRLKSLSDMIGAETLAALRAAHEAERRAEEAAGGLKDRREALKRARQALTALVPEQEERAMLAVAVRSETPASGTLRVTYNIDRAGWQPAYDLRLSRDSGALAIDRGALVYQDTGENWEGVAMTLSTTRPTERATPGEVWPWPRRIHDPDKPRPKPLVRAQDSSGVMAEAAPAPEPVVTAAAEFDGLSVTYTYPDPVSVASGADNLRLALDRLTTRADPVAQAAPLSDDTAFLVARLTNDTGEMILPTPLASFYLDGRFVGRRFLDLIPAGAEAELGFGAIEGIRIRRVMLDRSEGEAGVITRSSELNEQVRIEAENLTGENWPMRVVDRVPFSEQEDLEIDWQAIPPVSEENVDDRRGVLAWEFDLPPGDTQRLELRYTLEWPEGMVLE